MSQALDLLQDLVSIPGPPGQEDLVRDYLIEKVQAMGHTWSVDAKGNLHVPLGPDPKIVVTAHMDEIAMIVRSNSDEGLTVGPLGGLHPWKLGECPVQVLTASGPVNGVLSMGSVHTESPESPVTKARQSPIEWGDCRVDIGAAFGPWEQDEYVGRRVVVHPSRRTLVNVGEFVAGYFLDDRADLVSWLMALEELTDLPVQFIATTSEEVGGEGACYALTKLQPDVCIALELGPAVPDSPPLMWEFPTLWVQDSFAAVNPRDIDLLQSLEANIQLQSLSRGGSDASVAASKGLCARPITLGIPMKNTHGFEMVHISSMDYLADLTVRLVRALCN